MNPPTIENIADKLLLIKERLPQRQDSPEVVSMMRRKQEELEHQFLDELQDIRNQRLYEVYAMYANWYKTYKGVDNL